MKPEELSHLIASLRPKLLAQARRLSTDDSQAEDLVQDTLLQLWAMRSELPSHPNPEALAQTILRHKWNDHWRRQKTEQRILSEKQRTETATTEPSDDRQLLELMVSELPPVQQQVFRMKEMEGYEKDEVMQATGLSDDSVRQNLSRARHKLRLRFLQLVLASVVVLVAIGVVLHLQEPGRDYAIIDGKVTTDDQLIAREAEQALNLVSATEEETFDALELLN